MEKAIEKKSLPGAWMISEEVLLWTQGPHFILISKTWRNWWKQQDANSKMSVL